MLVKELTKRMSNITLLGMSTLFPRILAAALLLLLGTAMTRNELVKDGIVSCECETEQKPPCTFDDGCPTCVAVETMSNLPTAPKQIQIAQLVVALWLPTLLDLDISREVHGAGDTSVVRSELPKAIHLIDASKRLPIRGPSVA